MDTQLIARWIPLVLPIALAIITAVRWQARGGSRGWQRLALRHRLRTSFDASNSITHLHGSIDGFAVRLSTRVLSHTSSLFAFTRIEVGLRIVDMPRSFHISAESPGQQVRKFFHDRGVITGDDRFDDAFVLHPGTLVEAGPLVTDPAFRQRLLRLRRSWPTLSIDRLRILVESRTQVSHDARLERCLRELLALAKQLQTAYGRRTMQPPHAQTIRDLDDPVILADPIQDLDNPVILADPIQDLENPIVLADAPSTISLSAR